MKQKKDRRLRVFSIISSSMDRADRDLVRIDPGTQVSKLGESKMGEDS